MAKLVNASPQDQAKVALLIQKGLVEGGLDPAYATEVAAAMVSRATDELAKGHLPGTPGYDTSIPELDDPETSS